MIVITLYCNYKEEPTYNENNPKKLRFYFGTI